MCTALTIIRNINYERRDEKVIACEFEDARDHVRWCMKLCRMQAKSNRYFVYEHPAGATSWSMPEVKKVVAADGVERVRFGHCMLGFEMRDENTDEPKPVRKRTAVHTVALDIARRLD